MSFNTPSLVNRLYETRLESDYEYLSTKHIEKKIYHECLTKYSLGFMNWNNEEKSLMINEYGDMVERKEKSKLMLGSSIKIWKNIEERIV